MTHFAKAVLIPALALVAVACSSGDDTPVDPSVLADVEQALCADYGPVGSMLLDGQVYDMSDCSPGG